MVLSGMGNRDVVGLLYSNVSTGNISFKQFQSRSIINFRPAWYSATEQSGGLKYRNPLALSALILELFLSSHRNTSTLPSSHRPRVWRKSTPKGF